MSYRVIVALASLLLMSIFAGVALLGSRLADDRLAESLDSEARRLKTAYELSQGELADQREAGEDQPACRRRRQDRFLRQQRHGQQGRGAGHAAGEHDARGRLRVAQPFHAQLVARVEHRRQHAEAVADQNGARAAHVLPHQQGRPRQRQQHAGEEHRPRPLAEQQPGAEGDGDRRQVGEEGATVHIDHFAVKVQKARDLAAKDPKAIANMIKDWMGSNGN